MCSYRNIRYWLGDYRRVPPTIKEKKQDSQSEVRCIGCMSIHNFLRYNALDDWLFKQYENEAFEMNETQVNEEDEAEMEMEMEENAPHLFGRQEQIYMNDLRDKIATLL
ncbi:hypothetical protein MKX01_011560 [Papaver californicum]|nr:hypothetical protein MKX01_011560 [Papaver californicum]